MALAGWIKLHRALADHWLASNPDSLSVWVHLLMMANHAEAKRQINGSVLTVQAGQIITSRRSLSEKTGVQESKVERILKRLESEHQIAQRGLSKFRLISIVNWDLYQCDEQESEQQVNSRRTAGEQQVNTLEESKEWKECKEDKSSSKTIRRGWLKQLVSEGVDESHAKDWLAVRKAKRASNTSTAMNSVRSEAAKAGITLAEAVKISAENSWAGFKASWLAQAKMTASGKPYSKQEAIEEGNRRVVEEVLAKERERKLGIVDAPILDLGDPIIIEGEVIHAH